VSWIRGKKKTPPKIEGKTQIALTRAELCASATALGCEKQLASLRGERRRSRGAARLNSSHRGESTDSNRRIK